jgi:hypothetical protein
MGFMPSLRHSLTMTLVYDPPRALVLVTAKVYRPALEPLRLPRFPENLRPSFARLLRPATLPHKILLF